MVGAHEEGEGDKITNLLVGIANAHHLPQKWWFWAEPAPI